MELTILYKLQELHTPWLDWLMVHISALGNKGLFWIALALLFMIFRKTRKCGIVMMGALVLSVLVCNGILKNLVCRARPCWVDPTVQLLVANPTDFSFPSGHSSASFAAAMPILYCHKKKGIAAVILAFAIAFSRLYLFVHWPTDVLGGIILGTLLSMVSYLITDWFWRKKGYYRYK